MTAVGKTLASRRGDIRPPLWRRLLPAGLVLIAAVWLSTITVLISRTPPAGEASPRDLAAAVEAAVQRNDVDEARRLIADAPEDSDRISRLLTRAACGGKGTRVVAGDGPDAGYLHLLTPTGSSCGWLPIAEHDERWLIDLWAAPVR